MGNSAIYIGVDPSSSNAGVVALDSEGRVVAAWDSKKEVRRPIKASECARLAYYGDISKAVITLISMVRTTSGAENIYCAYESYSHNSIHRAFSIGEFNGILKHELCQHVKNIDLVAPTALKHFATGHGHSDKLAMFSKASVEHPHVFTDDVSTDITDAYWLAMFCWFKNAQELAVKYAKDRDLLRMRLEAVARHK